MSISLLKKFLTKKILKVKLMNEYLATLDIGTNSFHLIIVKIKNDKTFKIVQKAREVLRLGTELHSEKKTISKNEIERTVEVINGFIRLCNYFGASLRAVATSAVREAENKLEFVNEISNRCKVNIEILTGEEEGKYIFEGCKANYEFLKDSNSLCVDIGGGSTEFIFSSHGIIKEIKSVKLGGVRLSKIFLKEQDIHPNFANNCSVYVRSLLENEFFNPHYDIPQYYVFSAGTVQSVRQIALLNNFKHIDEDYRILTKKHVEKVLELILSNPSYKSRRQIEGLEGKRADIIPVSVLILNEILTFFEINSFYVSDFSLREGVILDSIKKMLN